MFKNNPRTIGNICIGHFIGKHLSSLFCLIELLLTEMNRVFTHFDVFQKWQKHNVEFFFAWNISQSEFDWPVSEIPCSDWLLVTPDGVLSILSSTVNTVKTWARSKTAVAPQYNYSLFCCFSLIRIREKNFFTIASLKTGEMLNSDVMKIAYYRSDYPLWLDPVINRPSGPEAAISCEGSD